MTRKLCLATALALAVLFPASSLQAQENSMEEMKKEIQSLNKAVQQMQKDLNEIKSLLRGRQAAPAPAAAPFKRVELDLGTNPMEGDPDARLTLIEFSDYQCPYCARHVQSTVPQIEKEYIMTGKVRHVFMDFPLERIHSQALKAAEAANCAGEQGQYWAMHARLFANQKSLGKWSEQAEAVGLDLPKFEECLDSGRQEAEIRRDMAEARKAGVTGTPAFLLAYTIPKSSKVTTEVMLKGAQPYARFKQEIDKLLEKEPAEAKKQAEAKKPKAEK